MVDTRSREILEVLLPPPAQVLDLGGGVAGVDTLREELDALGEEPEEAGEEALGPGCFDCGFSGSASEFGVR
jgi:hypothetical protein